jgi:hypothetical protein
MVFKNTKKERGRVRKKGGRRQDFIALRKEIINF